MRLAIIGGRITIVPCNQLIHKDITSRSCFSQVWFKNRRAKVRQQSAQGKPIVTNSESDAKTSSSPKKKTGSSSPLSGNSSNHTVRTCLFQQIQADPCLHSLFSSHLPLGATSSLSLARRVCWCQRRQRTAAAAAGSGSGFPLDIPALPSPRDPPTLSRLVRFLFLRLYNHLPPLQGRIPTDILCVELLVPDHPSRGFERRRRAPPRRPRFCRRFPAPAASSRADAGLCRRRRQSKPFTTFYPRLSSLSTVKTISGQSSQRVPATSPLRLKLSVRSIALLLAIHERDGAALLLPRHGTAPQLHLTLRDEPELLAETSTHPGHRLHEVRSRGVPGILRQVSGEGLTCIYSVLA